MLRYVSILVYCFQFTAISVTVFSCFTLMFCLLFSQKHDQQIDFQFYPPLLPRICRRWHEYWFSNLSLFRFWLYLNCPKLLPFSEQGPAKESTRQIFVTFIANSKGHLLSEICKADEANFKPLELFLRRIRYIQRTNKRLCSRKTIVF